MIYSKFVEAFKDYSNCYCIIGGNAASIILDSQLYIDSPSKFRQTKDYDMVIIAEVTNTGFSKKVIQIP